MKSVERLTGRGHIEPVSTHFELSLWPQNADIEYWRPEIGARKSSELSENRKNWASETQQRLANARECREYFCSLDMAHRDGTASLGIEDSNLQMSFCKTPFEMSGEFGLLPEHLGTRDWSRASCHNNYMHLPAGLAAWVTEFKPGSAQNF